MKRIALAAVLLVTLSGLALTGCKHLGTPKPEATGEGGGDDSIITNTSTSTERDGGGGGGGTGGSDGAGGSM